MAKRSAARWNRQLHRWGSMTIAAPLLLVLISGLALQLKKQLSWVQPPTQKGATKELSLSFDRILQAAASVPEAEITTWDDVDRLDVRPGKGMLKVRSKNDWEVQLDSQSGEVLQTAFRRSDWIESLHDGSYFGDTVKLWVFLPAGVILLGLWITGMYLFALPYLIKRSKAKRQREKLAQTS